MAFLKMTAVRHLEL